MYLEGQAARSNPAVSDRGFALAALLVAIAILSVMLLVALPAWRHHVQREREAELIFRGEQYARAIGLYQRKLAGAFPPSLDALVEQKFLRKRYKDPITGDDFEPVFASSQAAPGGPPPAGGRVGAPAPGQPPGGGRAQAPGGSTFQTPMGGAQGQGPAGQGSRLAGGAGGIVGVRSKATGESIRLYNGRNRYDQWVFVYVQQQQPGQTVAPDQQPRPGRGTPPPNTPGRGRGPF